MGSINPETQCHILLADDNPNDSQLIVSVLERGGIHCQYTFAANAEEFKAALENNLFDLVLSDYNFPSFSGMEALRLSRTAQPEVPFIFISGIIAEEEAVECVKKGATDYVLKSRMQRLALAVRRAWSDVAERQKRHAAELALKASEARLRGTLMHAPFVAIRWYDDQGRATFWNAAAEQLFERKAEEALGKPLHPPAHLAHEAGSFMELLQRVERSGRPAGPGEYSFQRADGSMRTCISTVFSVPQLQGPPCFVCMDVDITEQKNAEEALRQNIARVFQQEAALVALTRPPPGGDLLASIRRITETAAHALNVERVSFWQFGPARQAIQCVDLYELSRRQHSAGQELSRADFPAYFAAVEQSEIIAADDARANPATAEFSLLYLQPLGITSMLDVPIRVKGTLHGIICHEHVGPKRAWTSDERTFARAIANHMTLLIEEWERQHLEMQYRQAQKMEAVGQLAGGIAHDFNNLLAVIQMQSSLLAEESGLPDGVRENIQEIFGAVQRASNLTRQLLTFSRHRIKQPRNLDLPNLFGAMLKLLRRVVPENISLHSSFPSSLPMIYADPGMIEQVLMNLVINARDVMPQGGQITLALEAVDITEEGAALHPGGVPGRFVLLTVADAGPGIPAEFLPRIFEPFFTTKEEGRGTGLGLPTVRKIVEDHHGWIEVESQPGHGATFRILLPAIHDTVAAAPQAPLREQARGGHESILLVEDEAAVRSLARTILERHGYTVLEAANASKALKIWERARAQVDMLIADLILPEGLSGRELADRLQASKPDLKIIFSTGYSPEVVTRELGVDPGRIVLQKPFSALELAATVRRALDELAALRTARFAAAIQIYKGP